MVFWVIDGFRVIWWCGKEVGRCMEVWMVAGMEGVAAARLGSGWNGGNRLRQRRIIWDGGCGLGFLGERRFVKNKFI